MGPGCQPPVRLDGLASRIAMQHQCASTVLAMTSVRNTEQAVSATTTAHAGSGHRVEPNRLGRRRDDTRDDDILDAALDVLAEAGYSGMTVDMVAIRAKAGKATVYRRWRSKADLVLDAVGRMKHRQVDFAHLPDTGTLRGDLLALFKPQSSAEGERKIRIMAGLASLLAQQQSLADAANAVIVEPWAQAHYALMQRALDRGEIPRTSAAVDGGVSRACATQTLRQGISLIPGGWGRAPCARDWCTADQPT
jgi:AcrR family transcriptional regulator